MSQCLVIYENDTKHTRVCLSRLPDTVTVVILRLGRTLSVHLFGPTSITPLEGRETAD